MSMEPGCPAQPTLAPQHEGHRFQKQAVCYGECVFVGFCPALRSSRVSPPGSPASSGDGAPRARRGPGHRLPAGDGKWGHIRGGFGNGGAILMEVTAGI